MQDQNNLLGFDSLAFFGRVNASISHELKNIMAIISETAGFMKDLSGMATEGKPIDGDMLESSIDSIIEEIQRGFVTIRQMNRFAHSIDNPVVSVDVMDVLDLVSRLTGYLSFVGKTQIRPCIEAAPVVLTCPFILQAIVYEVVVQNFRHTEQGSVLDIIVEKRNDSAWGILFAGFSGGALAEFPDEWTQKMAASIGVRIEKERTDGYLELLIPEELPAGKLAGDKP